MHDDESPPISNDSGDVEKCPTLLQLHLCQYVCVAIRITFVCVHHKYVRAFNIKCIWS